MTESTERMLAFFGMHLIYFPVLILLLHITSWGYDRLGLAISETWYNIFVCLMAGGLYVGLGYATARLLKRRYPDSVPRVVPDPTRSGRYAGGSR